MRKGREKADNYTCKDAVRKGMNVQIPVFADTPFKRDEIWMRTRNSTLIDTLREEFVNGKNKKNGSAELSGCIRRKRQRLR